MPLIFFAYFFVEVLAFIGVAKWIGLGWAFLAIFLCMLLGGVATSLSMRSALSSAAQGRTSIGQLAGDSALLLVGWCLCVVPGFVSTVLGLLTVFPPTRGLIRRGITTRAQRKIDNFSMQVFNASPLAKRTTSYGTFTQPAQSHEVIDAEELEEMYRMDSPGEDGPEAGRRPGSGA